jgi:hypothetical protein
MNYYVKGFEATMMKLLSKKSNIATKKAIEKLINQLDQLDNDKYKQGAIDAINEVKWMIK